MRLHYLQHEPEEGLGKIALWAAEKNIEVSGTLLYKNEGLPRLADLDWLVIMGGNMGVDEEGKYPWLAEEKQLISQAIAENKRVFGVCLGAQLVAQVMGGQVRPNQYKEIGWFPVTLTPEAKKGRVFSQLPQTFMAFQWHGDTFEIPPNCQRMATSAACANQAFSYANRIVGLQFHPEFTHRNIEQLITDCGDELISEKYIQTAETMLAGHEYLEEQSKLLWILLDGLLGS